MALAPQFFRMARGEAKAPTFTPDVPPAGGIGAWTLAFYAWYLGDPYGTAAELTKAGAVLDAAAGTWKVALASVDTRAMAAGLWGWEAWRTDAGNESLLAVGTFELLKAKHTF